MPEERARARVAAPLPMSFFARDADLVARDLVGRTIVHKVKGERLACRIVETEAYFGPPGRNPHLATRTDMPARLRSHLLTRGDRASHSYPGITQRNRIMYGPPGFLYVYLIYGMHDCVNVVTGPAGKPEPQAVLLRAGEPLEGIEIMSAHRRARRDADIASGPAKLAKAMGISRAHYGLDVTKGALHFEAGTPATSVGVSKRIGVVGGEHLMLRYFERGNPHVSRAQSAKRRV